MFKDKQEECSTSQEIEQKFIFNSLQITFVKKTESLLFSLLLSTTFLWAGTAGLFFLVFNHN